MKYVITEEERQAIRHLKDERPNLGQEIRDMLAEIARLKKENKVLKDRIGDS